MFCLSYRIWLAELKVNIASWSATHIKTLIISLQTNQIYINHSGINAAPAAGVSDTSHTMQQNINAAAYIHKCTNNIYKLNKHTTFKK